MISHRRPAYGLRPSAYRGGQDIVAVGDGSDYLVQEEAGAGLDIFLMAGRAEPPTIARKGQQVIMLTMVAANPGKASLQIVALEEFVDDFGDDGAQDAVALLVCLGINLFKLGIVAVGALPERRLF